MIVGSRQALEKVKLIVVDGRGTISISLGDVGAACLEEAVAQLLLVNARLEIEDISEAVGNAVEDFLEATLEYTFKVDKLWSLQNWRKEIREFK